VFSMARSVPFSQSVAWKNENGNYSKTTSFMADILISELRSSIGYYRMQSEDSVDGIYLIGLPDIRTITEKFREAGYEVKIAQPYQDIPVRNKSNGLSNFSTNDYSAAISLAIRGLGV